MLSRQLIFPKPYLAAWIDVDLPEPGPDEILIRTRKTLISTGTELTAYSGDFPPDSGWSQWITYPFHQVGYSNVGDVIAVGSEVSQYEVGQRVVSSGRHASVNLVSVKQGLSSVEAGVLDAIFNAFW